MKLSFAFFCFSENKKSKQGLYFDSDLYTNFFTSKIKKIDLGKLLFAFFLFI